MAKNDEWKDERAAREAVEARVANLASEARSDQMVRRVFFGLSILFILFIVYASWTPGTQGFYTGRWRPFAGIDQLSNGLRVHNLRDITTNVLLYIPLGVFLSLAVSRRKPRFLSLWLVVGTLVSLTMEVGQSYIGRRPDVVDIITNTTGYLMGFWVAVASIRFYGLDPVVFLGYNPDDEQDSRTQSIAAVRFIYVCIYGLVALLPFDVSVSANKIYAQLFPDDLGRLKIILDPAYHLPYWQDDGLKLTLELLGILPIAALTAFLNGIRGRLSILTTVYTCVVVVALCEVAQVFVLSRTTDIVMIPLAIVAGVLGWALVKMWFGLQRVEVREDRTDREGQWRPVVVALFGYALVIAFFAWSPFDFETDPKTVARKIIHDSNLIPFKEHFSVRSLSSALDIIKEAGLFVPFGILVSFLLFELMPLTPRRKVVLLAGLISAAFATFTELSQSVCIGRYIDITDIALAGLGGICGAILLRLFSPGERPARGARPAA